MARSSKKSRVSQLKKQKGKKTVAATKLEEVGKSVGAAVKAVVVDPVVAVAAPWKHESRDWWMKRDFWATGTNPKKLKRGQELTDTYQKLTDIDLVPKKSGGLKLDKAIERKKKALKRYHKKLDRIATREALKKTASSGYIVENLAWPRVTGPPKLTSQQKARLAPAWQRKAFSKIHSWINGPKFSNRENPLNVYQRQQRTEMNALMRKQSSVDDTAWVEQLVAQLRHLFLTQPDRIMDDTSWMQIRIPDLWDRAQITGALKEKHAAAANLAVPGNASNTRNVVSVSTNVVGQTNKAMSKLKKSLTNRTTTFKMPKPKTQADIQIAGGPSTKKTDFGVFKPVVGNASRNLGIGNAMAGKSVGPQTKLIT